jgi:hypothetical protein
MEKCNAPELGVLYYYKHFLKIFTIENFWNKILEKTHVNMIKML